MKTKRAEKPIIGQCDACNQFAVLAFTVARNGVIFTCTKCGNRDEFPGTPSQVAEHLALVRALSKRLLASQPELQRLLPSPDRQTP